MLPYPTLPNPHLPPQLYSTQLNPPLPLALPSPLPALSNPSLPSLYTTLPYPALLHSTPLYSPLSSPPIPLPFPPLAALPSNPLLSPFILPYPTLPSTPPYLTLPPFPYPVPTTSSPLSQPTQHHSALPPIPSLLSYPTLPDSIPCTISYPALFSSPSLYPSLLFPTIPFTPHLRLKHLGPKGVGAETSRAEIAWCRNV